MVEEGQHERDTEKSENMYKSNYIEFPVGLDVGLEKLRFPRFLT